MAETEIALSPDEAERSEPEALQAGDGEAMPPRHQRASFAERVRNWLGGDCVRQAALSNHINARI